MSELPFIGHAKTMYNYWHHLAGDLSEQIPPLCEVLLAVAALA